MGAERSRGRRSAPPSATAGVESARIEFQGRNVIGPKVVEVVLQQLEYVFQPMLYVPGAVVC